MWIDFHVHGKLTKKSDFDLEHFKNLIDYAKEVGLDAIVLSEHFNTNDFYGMYNELEENFDYKEGHYLIEGFRVFMGLEVDVENGGHVVLAGDRENVLGLRKRLDEFTEEGKFISLKSLLDLVEEFNCLSMGAHPFRGEHPLALKQEIHQLERLDTLDLNATDIFTKGFEETENQLIELSKRLGNEIITGSDTHYPIQLGSVKTKLDRDCSTVGEIKQCIRESMIKREVSKVLDMRVFAARITKNHLKTMNNV